MFLGFIFSRPLWCDNEVNKKKKMKKMNILIVLTLNGRKSTENIL